MVLPSDSTQGVDLDDPWLIAEADYPVQGTAEEQLEFLVGYAVLGPSRYNRQPWKFTLRNTVMELRLDQARLLPVTDSRGREAIMNCGTALYYLQTAMRYFGYTPVVEEFPEPTYASLLAYIRQGEACVPPEEVRALFHAMRHRRTEEGRFSPTPLPSGLQESLRTLASQARTSLVFLDEPEQRIEVSEMVVEGENLLQSNPDYRQEAEAMRTESNDSKDWLSAVVSYLWEKFGHHPMDPGLVLDAPAIAVLCTDDDTPSDWLIAGQALGGILLTADTASVEASFLNQPIEILSMRPRLQRLVGGMVPQLILRLGCREGDYLPHTPGRMVPHVKHLPY